MRFIVPVCRSAYFHSYRGARALVHGWNLDGSKASNRGRVGNLESIAGTLFRKNLSSYFASAETYYSAATIEGVLI